MNVLLTGATNGFGWLAADLFSQKGHRTILGIRGGMGRWEKLIEERKHESLAQKTEAGMIKVIDIELSDKNSRSTFMTELRSILGMEKLDSVIHNAGYGVMGPTMGISEADLRKQMEVNYFAPLLLTQQIVPMMKEGNSKLILVSSIVGKVAFPMASPYCSSKHALEALGEALYTELSPLGIQTCLVEPGRFETGFSTRSTYSVNENLQSQTESKAAINFREKMFGDSLIRFHPLKVAKLLVSLSEAKSIPCRKVVGYDALALSLVKKFFPENLRAALTRWFFLKFFNPN